MGQVVLTKGVIPAAGLGTRLHPVTTVVPKELLPIGTKPMIHYVVEEAIASGLTQLAVIISPAKQAISHYFSQATVRKCWEGMGSIPQLAFIYQPKPLGLGDAISLAQEFVAGEPFALLLPDNIFAASLPAIGQLKEAFARYQASILSLIRINPAQIHLYQNTSPVVTEHIRNNIYMIKQIYPKGEQQADLMFRGIGRSILTPIFFDHIDQVRGRVGGELDDIQPLQQLILHQPLCGVEIQGQRYDTGNPLGYRQAFIDLG